MTYSSQKDAVQVQYEMMRMGFQRTSQVKLVEFIRWYGW